jgi:methyl-accepting chemotaxis protein
MSSEYFELRYLVEQVEKRAEGAHGRIDSINGRLANFDSQVSKLTRLMQDALEYMQSLQKEFLRSIHQSEENTAAIKRIVEMMDERQGRILHELASLRGEE